jgi:uncharacterized protein (DUF433 family)
VRTEVIWEQFLAGSSRDQVAEDFGLDPIVIEDAIKFEASRVEAVASAVS